MGDTKFILKLCDRERNPDRTSTFLNQWLSFFFFNTVILEFEYWFSSVEGINISDKKIDVFP